MKLKSLLRKSKTLIGLKSDIKKLRQFVWIIKRKQLIRKYLAENSLRKLQIGSNTSIIDGWLSSDLVPIDNECIYLDAAKKFPFANNTFDYVYSEHMIEHITKDKGLFMLQECNRILKRGGKIRIASPDIEKIIAIYTKRSENYGTDYCEWLINTFMPDINEIEPLIALNLMFRNWNHVFLYDAALLKIALHDAGFSDIRQHRIGVSDDVNLRNIEKHHLNVGNKEMVEFETMIFEAEKK